MSTTTFERQRTAESRIGLSAWAAMAGGVLGLVLGIPLAESQNQNPPALSVVVLNSVQHLLLMAGIAGVAWSRAAGQGPLAGFGIGLSQLAMGTLVIAEVNWSLSIVPIEVLYGLGSLALMLGLILAGLAVMRAGVWHGWRRFTVMACGLYIGVVIASFALPGYASNYAIGIWGVCWIALGLALRAEAR